MSSRIYTLLFLFLFGASQIKMWAQKKGSQVFVVNVYHMDENTCGYTPNTIHTLKSDKKTTKCYTGKKIKNTLNIELANYIASKDTLKKIKLRGYNPYFLVEYSNNDSLAYILIDEFGRSRASFYESKDSVLVTDKKLITLLENNIKQLKKDRKKQSSKH